MNQKLFFVIALLVSFQTLFSQEKVKELEEIKIVKEKIAIENKNGTIKIDVANSILNAVPNSIDLLAKLPKVQVSSNKESITIVGKGNPLIYIDNQRVEINDLNSLSVEDIKTVEIIENPSSKYEANGRVVILVTRKVSKKEGFKINVTENVSFQRRFNNYFGINSGIKKGRFEYKINFNYNQLKIWEKNGNDFIIPDYDIKSKYWVTAITNRPQFIYGGGFFYKINEDDYFSMNVSRRSQKDNFDIVTNTYNQQGLTINSIHTLNLNTENRNFTNGVLNYNHKIKSIDGHLFLGCQYSNFNQVIQSVISNNYNQTQFELTQNRNQKVAIDVFSTRFDFEKEFKNKMKLELGGLFLKANPRTIAAIESFNPSVVSGTDYNYKETNIAFYSNFSGGYKKINFSSGIRIENTIAKGKNASESNLLIDKNYINFFPKIDIQLAVDSTKTISFNYAKSITRPNFSTASQLSTYINPYFLWNNNININPTIIDALTFGYQYKDKTLKLSYNLMKNPVYYAVDYNKDQNLLRFQTENFQKESGFNIEFTLPFQYKKWSSTTILSGILNKVEDKLSVVNQSKPYLYFYSNHIFKLPKEVEFSLTTWGLTSRKEGVFDRNGLVTFDLAISKTFFKQFDCTLSYNDIFRKVTYNENFTINNISSKGVYYTDSNLFSIAIKYTFGKINKEEFRSKEVDENARRIR
ncbi:MAG: outer membrane beta-barrel family protein [Limnohabitans sp.]|nr:outer membrane beta-barrel family protein [Limnohabitans sp.]